MGMKIVTRYKRVLAMSAAALGLLTALTVEGTLAYFTASVSAEGSQVVNLGAETTITEEPGEMSKDIIITNASTENDCYVRVRAFAPDFITITYVDKEGNWSDRNDDYYYYDPILPASKEGKPSTTTVLSVKFEIPDGLENDRESFNLVVIQECTPVRYREDGTAYADWTTVYTDYVETNNGGEAGNP